MQQRRAVRGTVREERDCAAGDEEPATKSRASSSPTVQDEIPGRRYERNGPEGVESSTVDRQQSLENRGPARSPRLLRASARSRGVTSGGLAPVYQVGGKTAPVTAREERAVAGRQAGGGGGTCRRDTRTEI